MNEKIIVFSSEHDDDELFCSSAGEIWKGFGTEYKRFMVGIDQRQKGNLYCWDELPGNFDMLVVWEPLGAERDAIQKYSELLDGIRQECSQSFATSQELHILYHNSSHSDCKRLQEDFIQKLANKETAVFSASYSHIKSDKLYCNVAKFLKAGWNMADLEEYSTVLKKIITAWPDKSYRLYHLISLSVLLQGALAILKPEIIFGDSNDERVEINNEVFDLEHWFEECLIDVGKFAAGEKLDSIKEIAGCDNLQKLLTQLSAISSDIEQPQQVSDKNTDLLAGAHKELQKRFIHLRG